MLVKRGILVNINLIETTNHLSDVGCLQTRECQNPRGEGHHQLANILITLIYIDIYHMYASVYCMLQKASVHYSLLCLLNNLTSRTCLAPLSWTAADAAIPRSFRRLRWFMQFLWNHCKKAFTTISPLKSIEHHQTSLDILKRHLSLGSATRCYEKNFPVFSWLVWTGNADQSCNIASYSRHMIGSYCV